MRSLLDVSIRTKLLALLAGVVSLTLLISGAVLAVNDVNRIKSSMVEHHAVLADVLGANSTAALNFESPSSAEEVLSSLRLEPAVTFACSYDARGKVFATYQAQGSPDLPAPPVRADGASFSAEGNLEVFRQMIQEKKILGTIYLRVSMERLNAQIRYNITFAVIVLLAALAAALVLGWRLQRALTQPIFQLAQATEMVSQKGDYSLRVPKQANDELGLLCDGFNAMLAQVQERESRVKERTAELEAANQTIRERAAELEKEVAARRQAESALQTRATELEREITARKRAETEREKLFDLILEVGRVPPPERQEAIERLEPSPAHTPGGQLGQYRLIDKLGEGGMGTVYKALHTLLKRVVALKVLPAERMNDARAVARFHREMEAVGKLDHPNIVRASDAGQADGAHFLVMELVDGIDLSKLIERRGPLPVADACEIVRQAAVGLQHAGEHGLIHRDIKPSNLMLTPAGQVKVLDLGLARLFGDQPVGRELTASGQMMGTPDYMAPEQGFNPQAVDIRADVYSLGCTLYKLLTGLVPFGGPEFDTPLKKLLAHAQRPASPVRDLRAEISENLARVMDRLLAKNPAERFRNPGEVAMALTAYSTGCDLPRLLTSESGKDPAQGLLAHHSGNLSTKDLSFRPET